MIKKKLGVAKVKLSPEGKILETSFKPKMEINCSGIELEKLKGDTYGGPVEMEIQRSTDLIMASWFNAVNKIELADRDKLEIKSEISGCRTTKKGIKTCEYNYYLISVNKKVNPSVN